MTDTGPVASPTNAANIARNVDLGAYDAVVPLSGDGIVNELINGLASRPDALSALRIPIAPIPAGSGNALSVNIMGPDKVLDVAYAALNAIKGVYLLLVDMTCE
jgi:sphingosine kinase